MDCHFLKSHGLCRVEIDRMNGPFRIGIRMFSLRDQSVGSFGMLNDIHYKANLCGASGEFMLYLVEEILGDFFKIMLLDFL